MRRRRPLRWAMAALLGATFGGTCAVARWGGAGGGVGSAMAATFEATTLVDAAVARPLYPGATSPMTVRLANTNAFAVDIASITAGAVTSDRPGCGEAGRPTGVSLDLRSVRGTIGPRSSRTFTLSASMDGSSDPACQGATFSIPLTLVVQR